MRCTMDHPYFQRHKSFKPAISYTPQANLGIVVVLPSYNEPNLWTSLQSLLNCQLPQCDTEVIVVVNFPEASPDDVIENAISCIDIVDKVDKICNNEKLRFVALKAFDLPKKHAGVGLARKTGMDEAAWRLMQSASQTKIIACFDADATCSPNYLVELEKLWLDYPETAACSIRYEHPIAGTEFDQQIYTGIAQYELHLRYYVQAGRFIGHPFSYQTVGSSMACSANAYLKFGGMNKNKAGEDFYFLQKIIPHGNFREINSATIFPSPRTSHRVPFGTGRAMTKYLENNTEEYLTYNLNSFLSLKNFLFTAQSHLFNPTDSKLAQFLDEQPEPLKEFLHANGFTKAIFEINSNTSQPESFVKRFFLWFDAFKLLKYLNYAHEHYFDKQPVTAAASSLLSLIDSTYQQEKLSTNYLLTEYRRLDAST